MHWHAIRRSTGSREIVSIRVPEQDPDDQGNSHSHDIDIDIPLGHDNAADVRSASIQAFTCFGSETAIQGTTLDDTRLICGQEYLQVPMPLSSSGLTTFAYQLALQNRIKDGKLQPHGDYYMRAFKPTFIHDCLMLPGSLANLLGKLDTQEIINRMTPALLSGFHAYVHADTLQPCILQSSKAKDYVQGMVVFGLGNESRRIIHQHYRSHCRRVKVELQVDAVIAVPTSDRDFEMERWRLQRRKVWAHAWLWANAGSGDAMFRTQAPKWSIEDYLGGNLEPRQAPNVVEPWPDAEVDVSDTDVEGQPKQRDLVYGGGGGHLDYIRKDLFTGW